MAYEREGGFCEVRCVMPDIDSLSDRALDAAVAEKVMEWKPEKGFHTRRDCWRIDDRAQIIAHGGNIIMAENWKPSSDWSAAALVVERMREMGWRFWCGASNEDGRWVAQFSTESGAFYVYGETMPTAVCRAAMKAREAKHV